MNGKFVQEFEAQYWGSMARSMSCSAEVLSELVQLSYSMSFIDHANDANKQ